MSAPINRLLVDESFNRLRAISKTDAVVSQGADYSEWIGTIFKDIDVKDVKIGKHSHLDALQTHALIAAILLSPHLKAGDYNPTENFYTYCKLAFESEKINHPQSSARFVFPQVDSNPNYVAEESKTESADKAELETIFNGLAKKWRDETGGYSLVMRRYAHSSYQKILTLEPKKEVVKLILNELQQRPDRWLEALKLLTNENPAMDSKTFKEAVYAWVNWGRRENLIS